MTAPLHNTNQTPSGGGRKTEMSNNTNTNIADERSFFFEMHRFQAHVTVKDDGLVIVQARNRGEVLQFALELKALANEIRENHAQTAEEASDA